MSGQQHQPSSLCQMHTFEDGATVKLVRAPTTLPPQQVSEAEMREKISTGCYVVFNRTTGAIVRENPYDPSAPPLPTVREALVNARAAMEKAMAKSTEKSKSNKKPK